VAIHQPNFFPWLGFFDKWRRSDVFILLDDAQIQKTGGGWSNRAYFLGGDKRVWITASVDRSFDGVRKLNEVLLSTDPKWKRSAVQKFRSYYSSAPMLSVAQDLFEPHILTNHANLIDLNLAALLEIGSKLGLDLSKVKKSSEFSVDSASTERLCKLVKAVDGDSYLHGQGGLNYQEDSMFLSNGIQLIPQRFTQSAYGQGKRGDFLPGLSALDAIANVGLTSTAKLLGGSQD
jgi:hypothetical protein